MPRRGQRAQIEVPGRCALTGGARQHQRSDRGVGRIGRGICRSGLGVGRGAAVCGRGVAGVVGGIGGSGGVGRLGGARRIDETRESLTSPCVTTRRRQGRRDQHPEGE
ncbi:MAG: hypothetical protein DWQ36_20650 [Acidobacteria bacterium]|nr:MAG: hypothetical protein DWQ30_21075 [Acidobacteriota bacterium]REK03279.1 MAG: hypothetical protein DWQ36_20650 [Acidobacteriota bacterium]